MSIQGIRAGKAFVEFFIDDKAVNSGLAKVSNTLRAWGRKGLSVAGPITGAFGAAAATFASVGSELNDLHERTGLSVESLSELSFAAKQTGTDMGVVEKATKKLQQDGIDPLEFDKIAADLSAIPDHTQRAQSAMEVFGPKVGTALLPMLRDLPQLREQARQLGIVMSTEDATAADALGDAFDASKAQLVALTAQIGAAIAGPLTQFLTWSQGVVFNVIQFVHENPVLVQAIAATATAFTVASGAALTFGIVLGFISAHPIIAALSLLLGLLVGIASYFGFGSKAAESFNSSLSAVKIPGVNIPNVGAASSVGGSVVSPSISSLAAGQSAKFGSDPIVSLLTEIASSGKQTVDLLARNVFGLKAGAF